MTPEPSSSTRALCQEITRYVQNHPEAADSLEGIVAWWLPDRDRRCTADHVQEALAQLVSEHRLVRLDLADGRTLYQSADKRPAPRPATRSTPSRRQP